MYYESVDSRFHTAVSCHVENVSHARYIVSHQSRNFYRALQRCTENVYTPPSLVELRCFKDWATGFTVLIWLRIILIAHNLIQFTEESKVYGNLS